MGDIGPARQRYEVMPARDLEPVAAELLTPREPVVEQSGGRSAAPSARTSGPAERHSR